tara:strand:- start:547 stop:780 length:234 start_codon:yes stop_codon:yes gene_type:complete
MSALDPLGDFGDQEWMKFVLLALFGCSAVVLLLNLLIVRPRAFRTGQDTGSRATHCLAGASGSDPRRGLPAAQTPPI